MTMPQEPGRARGGERKRPTECISLSGFRFGFFRAAVDAPRARLPRISYRAKTHGLHPPTATSRARVQ